MELLFKKLLGYGGAHIAADRSSEEGTLGWMPLAALAAALPLLGVAVGNDLARRADPRADWAVWVSMAVMILPTVWRLVQPATWRVERLALVSWLGLTLYLVRLLASPNKFDGHDEYLHWETAIDISERHHLFTINSLLPVSPQYPGLELVQSAFAELSGLSVIDSAHVILAVFRVAGVAGLFLFYERVAGSSWIASMACLVYMANSNFISFLASFAYESIAIEFLIGSLFVAALATHRPALPWLTVFGLMTPLAVALAMSHHMTSWADAMLLVAAALAAYLLKWERDVTWRLWAMAAIVLTSAWIWGIVAGSGATEYIGNILGNSLSEFYALVTGASSGRTLFVSENGATTPLMFRVVALSSLAVTCVGLAIGFFRTLGKRRGGERLAAVVPVWFGIRDDVFAIVLTLLTLGYPLSMALRLTSGGWELGNRLSAFVYLGVGLVIAVGIADFWRTKHQSVLSCIVVSGLLTSTILGGAIAGGRHELPAGGYTPAADGQSIEPMGISAASWTRTWLGEGWRFASDRVNRLLLATYGVQRVVTMEQDLVEPGAAMFNPLGDEERNAIKVSRTEYLLVDLRLVGSRPIFGVYFSSSEDSSLHKRSPLLDNLLKFDRLPMVGRPYDNGFEVIYDIRGLTAHGQ